MKKEQLLNLLASMAACMEENRQYLTMLDTEIGDGDHGINMARGFHAVKESLPDWSELDMGSILVQVGKTLIREVAGTSGPLYGSAIRCAGKLLGEKEEITLADFTQMLGEGIGRIQQLGKASEGEKNMLDAMLPAYRALANGGTLKDAEAAAAAGMIHTKDIVATKGRASYVGKRSLGHQDPGATSFTLLLSEIAKVT